MNFIVHLIHAVLDTVMHYSCLSFIGCVLHWSCFLDKCPIQVPSHFQLPFLMGQENGYQTWAGDYLIPEFIKIRSGDSNVE